MSTPEAIISRVQRGASLDLVAAMCSLQPITTNSISRPDFDAATVQRDAEATRIIVHPRYPRLVHDFLAHKRSHGSRVEKALYGGGWTWRDQVARLVAKRPLVFMNSDDSTVLRSGESIGGASAQWDRVGTDLEGRNANLRLAEYLSYDEIMLGSLLGVSSPSYFINDGSRGNSGVPGAPGDHEHRGVIMGLVGARFERPDRMDSAYMQPAVAAPRQHPELDRIFRDFFLGGGTADDDDDDAAAANERKKTTTKKKKTTDRSFDVDMYKARMRITFDILLLEADARAATATKKAHVYVVGLGLGVWSVASAQTDWYLEAFADSLRALDQPLVATATIEFAWMSGSNDAQRAVVAAAKRCGVDNVVFSKRNPAAKLRGSAERLLVLSYAWDGNAFPGNEYWEGALSASGDPAAACMSTISELHNPIINPDFLRRVHVV